MTAQHKPPFGAGEHRIEGADLQDADGRRHTIRNDPEAQAMALLPFLV